ncbi:MAG TPA: lytic transglycosylase domain-containing protein [Candidatus Bathyarchaeia archaeon]|nr:lytic transglycosylase domain-containing protein [Candidatus Bathyarchaeia archaeon]
MRWIVKSFAVLTVLSWIVIAALFARPVTTSAEAFPIARAPRRAAAATVPPANWSVRVLESADEIFPGASPASVRQVAGLAERYARRFGVDPLTVMAVVHVESRFDPNAVSPKGAIGLMQLQAETARSLAADLGLQWTGDELLYDPDVNVLLGTFYLRRLIDRFGDVDAALAAYCSGPTLVEALLDGDGKLPLRYSDRVWDVLRELHVRTAA